MKQHVDGVPTGTPSPRHVEEFYGAGPHGHAVEHDRDDRLVEVRSNRKVPDGRVARGGARGQRRRRPGRGRGLRGLGLGRRRRGAAAARRASRQEGRSSQEPPCLQRLQASWEQAELWALLQRLLVSSETVTDGLRSGRRAGKGGLRDGILVAEYASFIALRTGRPHRLRLITRALLELIDARDELPQYRR